MSAFLNQLAIRYNAVQRGSYVSMPAEDWTSFIAAVAMLMPDEGATRVRLIDKAAVSIDIYFASKPETSTYEFLGSFCQFEIDFAERRRASTVRPAAEIAQGGDGSPDSSVARPDEQKAASAVVHIKEM